eukprot:jgi/Tetstr1/438634/TSEL_027185.t1
MVRRSAEPSGMATPPLMQSSQVGPLGGSAAFGPRQSLTQSAQFRSTARRSVPASYAYQSQTRSAPFSVHSRGVPIHDFSRYQDINHILWSTFRQMRDVGSSFFYLCMMQSASTLFSMALTMVSYLFFAYSNSTARAITQGSAWTFVGFVIFLPVFGLSMLTFMRRERALKYVASVKSLALWIYLAHRDWVPPECLPEGHLGAVQQTIFNILGEMRGYLLPPRYYTTTFPYTGVRHKMMTIAQDRAKYIRRIASNFKKLSQYNDPLRRAGLDSAGLCKLTEMYCKLHNAFEQMANVKEYRTPVPLRALTRFYVLVVVPLFFGPYYVSVSTADGFNIIFAMLMNFAMLALLTSTINMEDPFDNQGLDGIYIDEPLSECEQTINMDEDHELEMAVNESLGGALGASMMHPLPQGAAFRQSNESGYAKTEPAKVGGAKTVLRSHEVVDVHVEDRSHDATADQEGGDIEAARDASENANDQSIVSAQGNQSDKSEQDHLGLGFVMPPQSPDDAPNYESLVSVPDMHALHHEAVVDMHDGAGSSMAGTPERLDEDEGPVEGADQPVRFFNKQP